MAIKGLKDAMDLNLYFFDSQVELSVMFLILAVAVIVLLGVYVLLNVLKKKEK